MKKILSDIFKSFKYEDGGYSGRKMSALFSVLLAGYLSEKGYPIDLIIVWLVFASVNLGLVTTQQLIEFRTGKKETLPEPKE